MEKFAAFVYRSLTVLTVGEVRGGSEIEQRDSVDFPR